MKKFFVFAALAALVLASCKKKDEPTPEPEKPEAKTAIENLVAYFPLESATEAVKVGEGVSYETKGGAGNFGAGYIGQGYVNTAGNNNEAFLKLKLTSNNALAKLQDVTFTAWVKNPEDFQKGALISVNGKNFPTQDWPSMIAYFDNKGTDEETGVKKQQVNGRFMFKNAEGAETNLWLDTWDPAFAVYGKWFQFAFTYQASSGAWALYVDGVKVREAEYGDKMPFGKCIPADASAIYVGGWSSFIEKYPGAAEWQMYFGGSIDEIRFYNKPLTEAEIQSLRKEEVAIALS